jgi:hypothetical protein
MRYISKQAAELDMLKQLILSLWNKSVGPCENIFGLLTNIIPFVPGVGWGPFMLEKVLSFLGFGLDDFGRLIDKELGLGPGSDFAAAQVDSLNDIIKKWIIGKIATKSDEELKKIAFFGGVWKLITLIPSITKMLFIIIKTITLALGVKSISEIYTLAPELIEKGVQLLLNPSKSPEEISGNKSDSGNLILDVEKVKNLVQLMGEN